jgi:hypothetical protein
MQVWCQQCNVSNGEILSKTATSCSDIDCLATATSLRCIENFQQHGAKECIFAGYGWNHVIANSCDVCGINYHSRRNSNGYNSCIPCPPHFTTVDIGMSECIACPDFHRREQDEAECVLCGPGTDILCAMHKMWWNYFGK